jgi:tetratricopeptide (TPR) repeat protein
MALSCFGPLAERAFSASAPSLFTDVTVQAGITHRHRKPTLDRQLDNIMSWVCSVGAAAAAADFDHDGWIDLYVTNSRQGEPNFLYKNNGDGTFTDVAKQAGLADVNTTEQGASMDCVWGDYDNDGWPDLYLVRWGTDSLYRNNGDGTFSEVTAKLFKQRDGSPGTDWANGCAAIFWDYNLDGRLDIYVGNYFDEHDLWHLKTTRIMHDDFEKARNAGRNFLYRQNPDGTFTQVAHELGLDDPGWTLSVGSADVNNDGWPDLYIADDFGPDQLFLNNKQGGFTDVTRSAIGFDTKKGMNVDFGDIDGDGWLDIYVANITTAEYLQEGNMLWHNNGPGTDGHITFTDIALETGTYDGGWGWGAKFFDYDHDGDLDILAVNGFISAGKGNYWYDLASWTVKGQDVADAKNWPTIGDRSFSGYEKDRFWQNDGNYAFRECAGNLGLASERDGRGIVCFDYDNDGDLDLFVANQDQPPNLYRNNLIQAAAGKTLTPALALSERERENVSQPPDRSARSDSRSQPPPVPHRPRRGGEARGEGAVASAHWLMLSLVANPATKINRGCLGTRVTAITSTGRLIREHNGGKSYCGQSDPRVHFGLGREDRVRLLEVRWPDGGLQYLENIRADQLLTIRQDPSQYASQLALTAPPPKPWQRPKEQQEKVVHKLSPEELDKMLSEMEKRLRESLDSFQLASAYRARCADYDQHDRAIKFFESILAKDPNHQRARMELACAFVDKIPTCGGMAAIVSKGTLARKSLDQMDAYLAKETDSWLGLYTRGMNHLHWPRALLHSDDAAADLTRCAELQEKDPKPKPYYLRTYIALGDAYTKAKEYAEARAAWRRGQKYFPNAKELKDRLAIKEDGALLKYVEAQRSLEKPIDTDLSFMDRDSL